MRNGITSIIKKFERFAIQLREMMGWVLSDLTTLMKICLDARSTNLLLGKNIKRINKPLLDLLISWMPPLMSSYILFTKII